MEKLFNEWYKQQCINENAKESSFICDGSLSDDYLEQHEILFVCRESHDTSLGFKKYFWFKNVVDGLATKGKKYYNCVKSIIDYINNNIEPENANIDIKKCGYINVNKKGGSSACNFQILDEYAKKYQEYIIEEIKILNPKRIVLLGKLYKAPNAESIFVNYGRENNIPVYLYDKHPCVYSKDMAKHLKLL